jgi:hypothetical protein
VLWWHRWLSAPASATVHGRHMPASRYDASFLKTSGIV